MTQNDKSMKIDKIVNEKNPDLILCLAGWSASPEIFRHLEAPADADVWIGYDYRDLIFEEDLSHYSNIHLIAWSLGVWVATYLWAGKRTFTTTTALNGTPFPIHDTLGIPPVIFEGTLSHISDEGMRRFNRRMCGDSETFRRYTRIPSRPLQELQEELKFLRDQILSEPNKIPDNHPSTFWNRAIISAGDRIFPSENLRHYWQDRSPITGIDAPHLPFYQYQTWNELWK